MLLFGLLTLSLSPSLTRAAQQPAKVGDESITVRAQRINYFSNAATVQARGSVSVALADGSVIEGDAFSMDLALQRFLVVGHVRLHTTGGELVGAGFADFLQFRRMYFIPLDPTADRWTFLNGDYAHPEKGRVMPGDAFYLADFSDEKPYIVATEASIDPAAYVKFTPATFVLLNGALWTPHMPPYVYNFSSNQNFAVNALSGASFDAPYNFAGTPHSLDAVHLRYDQQRKDKTYLSFEHHSVFGEDGYLVFSLNPATQPRKQWNLYGYERLGEHSAASLQTQLFTYQFGFSRPLAASGFVDLQLTQALSGSSLRLDMTGVYDTLLAPNDCPQAPPDVSGCAAPNHPFIAGLSWLGFSQHLGRSGLSYRLQTGIAHVHDTFGVGTDYALPTVATPAPLPTPARPPNVWATYAGATLYTPVYRGPLRTGLSAIYQVQRTWLTYPNTVDQQTLIISDSKRASEKLALVLSMIAQYASARDVSATIVAPNIATGLTPQPLSPNGLPVIAGVGMLYPAVSGHSYILTASYAGSPDFQTTLAVQQNNYRPVQAPFVGGPPKYQFTAGMRVRIGRTLFIDIQRGYNFNWGGQRWSPQFALQVVPQ